ncbi:MAG: porin [Burkholderiaceae bacterium]|nr:MAG: porin [Burkholderiaceae bacterium]
MKKSLLALALLAAGAASAESSVTLYGKLDLGLARNIGTPGLVEQAGSTSRFGLRGTEELGGGLKAFFNIEHRFLAQDGTVDGAKFYKGRSVVGLEGDFGKVTLGRQETVFYKNTVALDPWGGDWGKVASVYGGLSGETVKTTAFDRRQDNAVSYEVSSNGFGFGVQAGAQKDAATARRPINFALSYAAGPLSLVLGYTNPSGTQDKATAIGGAYDFGAFKLTGGAMNGTNVAGVKLRGAQVGIVAPVGTGTVKLGYASVKVGTAKTENRISAGYAHPLSKRTFLYTDLGYDKGTDVAVKKAGFDFGIQHNF